jgi:hypothetical protein
VDSSDVLGSKFRKGKQITGPLALRIAKEGPEEGLSGMVRCYSEMLMLELGGLARQMSLLGSSTAYRGDAANV